MGQNFAGWVLQSLKNMIKMPTKSRSEKENSIGMFLLFSGVVWVLLPLSPVRLVLQFAQVFLGAYFMFHGIYLKSTEADERERKWRADIMKQETDRMERYNEGNKQLREMTIERIAEAEGISLEEAGKKADETKWLDTRGNTILPPWMIEKEEKKEYPDSLIIWNANKPISDHLMDKWAEMWRKAEKVK